MREKEWPKVILKMLKFFSILKLIKSIPKTSWSSKKPLNIKPKIKTLFFLVFGLFLFGLGETLLLASGAGVSPWTVLAEGLSIYTSYSVGWCTLWVSLFVLLLWFPLKQKPGIGTILNAIIMAAFCGMPTASRICIVRKIKKPMNIPTSGYAHCPL